MSIRTIAIVSPGAMGHAVGRILRERGLDVVTCLEGRSARTRGLAGAAGVQDMPSLEAMVAAADLVLSIMPSRAAALVARRIADAMLATDKAPAFAECNAIAPEHVRQIAAALAPTGAAFIDAGIVGPPPEGGRVTRFYASGAQAGLLEVLEGGGLEVRILGEEVGQASALKMCYAGLTKGAQGLYAAVLVAAEALGLSEPLAAQMRDSEAEAWARMQPKMPRLPARAARWAEEMEEIAATLSATGVTPHFHQGAHDMFALIAGTPLGSETPEDYDRSRTPEQAIETYARSLPPPSGKPRYG